MSRATIEAPEGFAQIVDWGLDISKDGRQVVFMADYPDHRGIYRRSLDELDATLVEGTVNRH